MTTVDEMLPVAGSERGQLEVITRFPVPLNATATNFSSPVGPPHVIETQLLSAGES